MSDIELVIKIPEEEYALCKKQWDTECLDTLMIAVKYGTPLPKHHGRLIDADDLREDFKASKKISFAERMDISCIVDHAPTIIEGSESNDE